MNLLYDRGKERYHCFLFFPSVGIPLCAALHKSGAFKILETVPLVRKFTFTRPFQFGPVGIRGGGS